MATISVNGTYYQFAVTSANATSGATYTNNGVTFTVNKTISAGTILVCTAAAGSVTSGTTLTKASGTGDATITFSSVSLTLTNENFTYAAGDTLNFSGNQNWTITQTLTTRPGPINFVASSSKSTMTISNTSTTTPLVISMNTQNSDLTFSYQKNKLVISGDWIQLTTGNGAQSQTLDFTSLLGGVIDWPSCVWVETGDPKHYSITPNSGGGQGYFMPFFNIGNGTGSNTAPDYDVQNIQLLTDFYGDYDHGPVFKYDSTSKIATFGKGGVVGSSLGGAIPGNGKRILYPNIHLTSSVYDAANGNRNNVLINTLAKSDCSIVAFSHNFGWNNSQWLGCGDCTWTSVGVTGKTTYGGPTGTLSIKNWCSSPDVSYALSNTGSYIVAGGSGDQYHDFIFGLFSTTTSYSPGIQVNNSVALKQFSNIFGFGVCPAAQGTYPVMLESILIQDDAPLSIGPIYNCGGQFYFRECDNIHMTEIWNSDRTTGVASTTNGNTAISILGCKNITVGKIRIMTNGAPTRGQLVDIDASSFQIACKDISYNGASNTAYILAGRGERVFVANAYLAGARSALFSGATGRRLQRFANLYSDATRANATRPGGTFVEWDMNSDGQYSGTSTGYDAEPFNPIWTNAAKTTGRLCIGPPIDDKNDDHMAVISGTEGTDFFISGNTIYAPNAGVEIIFTNRWPIRGITDFSGNTVSLTHTGFTTNAAIEISMRVNDGTDTSTWTSWVDATTAGNWQTALASLTGYTSAKGFFVRLRLTTSGASASRSFAFGYTTCTPDSAWTPEEIGFIPIAVSGHVANSCVALYDNTVPASPVLVKKKTLGTTATETMDLPYNFDATAKSYKVVLRKAGYGEAIISDSSYQKGKSAPFSQVLYTSIVDATASAIAGVSVNGATNTVTISASNTYQDIHQYLQWWGAQVANMGYAIPSVTSDNVNYSSSYNFIVNTGVSISGSFALTLTGGATLTMNGTASSSGNILHTSGTKAWTRIQLTNLATNSRVQIYDTNTSTELFNGLTSTSLEVQRDWTADHTIRYRVSYCSGVTAKHFIESTVTFTNQGLLVKIDQTDDAVYIANAVDGSTVTGITITPSPARVRINLAGGTVPWKNIYAYQVFWLYGATGIADEAAFIEAKDTANYTLTGFDIRNDSTVPLTITGGWGKDSVTNTIAGVIDVAGSVGNIYAEPDHIIPYGTAAVGLTLPQFLALK